MWPKWLSIQFWPGVGPAADCTDASRDSACRADFDSLAHADYRTFSGSGPDRHPSNPGDYARSLDTDQRGNLDNLARRTVPHEHDRTRIAGVPGAGPGVFHNAFTPPCTTCGRGTKLRGGCHAPFVFRYSS